MKWLILAKEEAEKMVSSAMMPLLQSNWLESMTSWKMGA